MSKFILEINLGNDAMQTYGDIERAIRAIPLCRCKVGQLGNIRDRNGNTVGHYEVTE